MPLEAYAKTLIARVAVDTAIFHIDKPYDYIIPDGMSLEPGQRVLVPFGRGNRRVEAMVLAIAEDSDAEGLKAVACPLDENSIVDQNAIRLAFWMNERFYCTVYEAFRAMLPVGLWYKLSETVVLVKPFEPEGSYNLISYDQTATHALEFLVQSKGQVSLDAWKSVLGAKWATALDTLSSFGLAERTTLSSRRSKDKTELIASLAQPPEEIRAYMDALPRTAKAQREILKLLINNDVPIRELLLFTGTSRPTLTKLEKNGIVNIEEKEILNIPEPLFCVPKIELNAEQEIAYRGISELRRRKQACCALLKGVTGSGKTLVYIKLLQDVIKDGGQAIVLVPEIALTPQLIAAFSNYFGDDVAVLHSALGITQRCNAWRAIRKGIVSIVVGTRSAVFAPFERLSMIIIDEEQEYTYKSENSPRYHARDTAKFRCVQHSALLVLASATPSLETMYCAAKGTYTQFELSERFNKKALPTVQMADMRTELRNGNDTTISGILAKEIEKNIAVGEQTILFLNRRGYHRIALCRDCGETRQCTNCSVPLTFHAFNHRFMCHYCGYSVPRENRCRDCGGETVFIGAGTQKVVEDLNALFPDIEILRMDTDTTGYKGAHEALLRKFSQSRIPVLVGTQMIAKGLDIENVTLIGVIAADMMLYMDDYRANERTFALIAQVIGRAGRGEKAGRAIVQTMSPKHPVLIQAAEQDYNGFFESELTLRSAQGYPPFGEMITLNLFCADLEILLRSCLRLRGELDRAVKDLGVDTRVFGPAPARVTRINNKYRYHISICGSADAKIRRMVAALLRSFRAEPMNKGVTLYADLHPNDF
jgi:primosomal protein N' (replication factor Y)